MKTTVQVVFYSMYGHTHQMAIAIAEGASEVEGVEASLWQVPELVPTETSLASGSTRARECFRQVPEITVTRLAEADAIVFGTPTRFGNMSAQMRNFLDQTGGLWARGALIGKVGSVFTSVGSQHAGHETTLTSFHCTLLHHGMVIVGVPSSERRLMNTSTVSGGTPYGASTVSRSGHPPTEDELAIARFQGRHVAEVARRMKVGGIMGQMMSAEFTGPRRGRRGGAEDLTCPPAALPEAPAHLGR
jgi:NAD(P)H dehydrogenase (quinone)